MPEQQTQNNKQNKRELLYDDTGYVIFDVEEAAKTDEFWQERAQRFCSFDGDFTIIKQSDASNTKQESINESDEKKYPETIVNPDTGNKIKFASALKYDKESKVYKAAAAYLTHDDKQKIEKGSTSSSTPEDAHEKKSLKAFKTLNKYTKFKDKSGKVISFEDALKLPDDHELHKQAKQLWQQKIESYKIFKSFSPEKQKQILAIKAPKEQSIYKNEPDTQGFDPKILELGEKAMGADLMKYHESVMDCLKKKSTKNKSGESA